MGRSGGAASGASFAELYAELCVIGRGSFGEVLKVRRRSDSRTLVCKVLSYGQMSEKEKQLVVSEVNILRELKHRHVVQYFDRVLDKRAAKIYIIMEYCENGDMGRQIKRMRRDRSHFEETRVWKFLAQLLLAFEACHNRKDIILHRDIKPCNIFLDRDMNIKVGDFGLAKELGAESQFAYTNVGTPYYMSPELINEKRYNEKSDIWALGCLIYEMCALRPPFEAANVVSLGKRISAGRFSRIPMRYSDELQAVVQSMLTLSPTRRPSVSQLMSLPRVGSYVVRARESITRSMARASESTEGSTSATSSAASSKAEAALAARAKEIRNREHALRVKEKQLAEREDEVRRREQAVREQEDALVHREEALAARESRTADLEAEFAARQRKSAVTAATTPTSASETLSTLSHGSLADHRGFRLTVDACASDDDDDDGNHAQGVRNHKDRKNPDTADSIRSRDPAEEQETLITPRLSTRPQRQRPATGSDRRRGVISRGSPPATTGFADGAAPSRRATPSSARSLHSGPQRQFISPKFQQENLAPRPASSAATPSKGPIKVSPGATKPRPTTSMRRSPLQKVTPTRQQQLRPIRTPASSSSSSSSKGTSRSPSPSPGFTRPSSSNASRRAELAAARARGLINRDFVSRHKPAAFRHQQRVQQSIPR